MTKLSPLTLLLFAAVLAPTSLAFTPASPVTTATAKDPWSCKDSLCRFVPGNPPAKPSSSKWKSWAHVENFFVFGASIAFTGNTQADILTPTEPYKTSCNGPNYINRLSNGYNQSLIATDMLAVPGMPVAKVGPTQGENFGFIYSAESFAKSWDAKKPQGWSAENSLYHTEFGINDIGMNGDNFTNVAGTVFDKYAEGFEKLYAIGARNFLVLDVPPIDRAPDAAKAGVNMRKNGTIEFNWRLSSMLQSLGTKYPEATFFRFSIHELFDQVLDHTKDWKPTSVYKDFKTTCDAYTDAFKNSNSGGLPSKDYKSPKCEYAVNEYLYMNGVHPTYPLHEQAAAEIAWGLEEL